MVYRVIGGEDSYAELITQLILQEFPQQCNHDSQMLLELLTAEIVATGQVRFGPKPKPESLVEIRKVITHYVEQKLPIPFLVPWGSQKPNGDNIDIAELSALRMLSCLQKRVQEHYAPGVQLNIRIEDASAPNLFFEDMDKTRRNDALYTQSLVNLVRILELDSFIKTVPESLLVTEEEFNSVAAAIRPDMEQYLTTGSASALEALTRRGWKGAIPEASKAYYLKLYEKLYPNTTPAEKIHILARYFSGSLARYKLKSRGDDPTWQGQFIDLTFVPPIPGMDQHFSRYVYYRTTPGNITRNHMPPWRAKGFVRIGDDNVARIGLAPYGEVRSYNTHCLTLNREETQVCLRADYVVQED